MRDQDASLTAASIVFSAVACASDPALAGLVPAEAARLATIFADGLTARWPLRPHRLGQQNPLLRTLGFASDRLLTGGFQVHFMLRKAFIEAELRALLAGGAKQLVVIGAGFDTLALRLAREFPALRCLEIDHPASQTVKLRLLAGAGEQLPPNFSAVAADLAKRSLADVLREQASFRPEDPVVFVAEGLLMYLPEPAVHSLFATVREVSRGGAWLVFSHTPPPDDRKLLGMGIALRLIGEPFLWGVERDALPGLLAELGFSLEKYAGAEELKARFLPASAGIRHRSSDLEHLAVARSNEATS